MGNPLASPNGSTPVRVAPLKDASHPDPTGTLDERHSRVADSGTARQTMLDENAPYVGLMTRLISWAADLLLINLVALITGLGAQLIASIFPITKNLKPVLLAIAGGVYILWTAAYFVAFWSVTGQTLGSRLMQVRLVTASGEKVKPVRALVRWIGMNLALVPLPWGYLPIPFKRLGFPDWLAHTRVIEVQQPSIAAAWEERSRGTRDISRPTPAPIAPISPTPDSRLTRSADDRDSTTR
jgi:uncharacterized RDD family membrane protein YckC